MAVVYCSPVYSRFEAVPGSCIVGMRALSYRADLPRASTTNPAKCAGLFARHWVDRMVSTPQMNVVFVSHCDFTGNSAMHLFSVANELSRMGVRSVVCVPSNPETVQGHGVAHFQVLEHKQAAAN